MSTKKRAKKSKATPLQDAARSYQAAYWRMVGKCLIHMSATAHEDLAESIKRGAVKLPPGVSEEDAFVLAHSKSPRDCDPPAPDKPQLQARKKELGVETMKAAMALYRASWRSVLEPLRSAAARLTSLLRRNGASIADMRPAYSLAEYLKLGGTSLPHGDMLTDARDLLAVASHEVEQASTPTGSIAIKGSLNDWDRQVIAILLKARVPLKLNDLLDRQTRIGRVIGYDPARVRLRALRKAGHVEGDGRGRFWHPDFGQ